MERTHSHSVMEEFRSYVKTGSASKKVLSFNTQTGKLESLPRPADDANSIYLGIAKDGFFGGCFIVPAQKDRIHISHTSGSKGDVTVQTMHLSCKSDTYEPSHNYGGIIIYQYDGMSEWRTANNTHCKAGYVVIQNTDSEMVTKWENEPGQVHGAIYRNAFGESVKESVIGEGFAIRNKIEINSGVFNNPPHSEYHDHRRRIHELSEHCVRKVVEHWRSAGPCWFRKRNFEVKELLEDFDLNSIRNHCTYEEMCNKPPRTEIEHLELNFDKKSIYWNS